MLCPTFYVRVVPMADINHHLFSLDQTSPVGGRQWSFLAQGGVEALMRAFPLDFAPKESVCGGGGQTD
jgi:hypothetical protein